MKFRLGGVSYVDVYFTNYASTIKTHKKSFGVESSEIPSVRLKTSCSLRKGSYETPILKLKRRPEALHNVSVHENPRINGKPRINDARMRLVREHLFKNNA